MDRARATTGRGDRQLVNVYINKSSTELPTTLRGGRRGVKRGLLLDGWCPQSLDGADNAGTLYVELEEASGGEAGYTEHDETRRSARSLA